MGQGRLHGSAVCEVIRRKARVYNRENKVRAESVQHMPHALLGCGAGGGSDIVENGP